MSRFTQYYVATTVEIGAIIVYKVIVRITIPLILLYISLFLFVDMCPINTV